MKVFNEKDIQAVDELISQNVIKVSYDYNNNVMNIYAKKSQVITDTVKKYLKSFKSIYTVLKFVDTKTYDEMVLEDSKFPIVSNTTIKKYVNWKDMDTHTQFLWIKQHPNVPRKGVKEFLVKYTNYKSAYLKTVKEKDVVNNKSVNIN